MDEFNIKNDAYVGVSYVALADTHQKLVSQIESFKKLNAALDKLMKDSGSLVNELIKHTDQLFVSLADTFSDITVQKPAQKQVQASSIPPSVQGETDIDSIIKNTEDLLKRIGDLKLS